MMQERWVMHDGLIRVHRNVHPSHERVHCNLFVDVQVVFKIIHSRLWVFVNVQRPVVTT